MTDRAEHTADKSSAQGHESPVLSGWSVFFWGLALAGLILVGLAVTWGVWQWLRTSEPKQAAPITAMAPVSAASSGTRMTLNPDQRAMRREYEQRQESLLREYGWINRQQQIAHIPIERAMQIVVQREKKE